MGNERVLVVFLVIFSSVCFSRQDASASRTYELSDYCGKTIELSCTHDGWGRAGVLKFSSYPTRSCTINVTINTSYSSCSSYEYYAIYFNIKNINIGSGDYFIVKEKVRTSSPTIVKSISGSTPLYSINPRSYGQVKSAMTSKPLLSITWKKGFSFMLGLGPFIQLDYNVVHNTSYSSDSYCRALSGYVANDLLCEKGDRVNCPSSYIPNTGYNPAHSKNQGYPAFSVCETLGWKNTVGVAIGSLIVFILFIALVSICHRRRGRQRVIHHHVASTNVPVNNIHIAYVTDGHQPYPVQQPTFAGAPPAYGAIYPQQSRI